jgi:hypothetical protein
MGDRRRLALGSLLIGAALVLGVLIGRATVSPSSRQPAGEPSAPSTRFHEELTDTTPLAAPFAEELSAPPPAQSEAPEPAVTAALPSAARPPVKPAAPAPPPAAAPAAPAPAPVTPPAATAAAAAPPPDPGLVSQGRVFTGDSITSSSFDDEDVTEYDPVPDHEVTRSSFDDDDRVDSHPTGP